MSSRFGGIWDRGSCWSRRSVLQTGPGEAPRMTRNASLGTVQRDEEGAPRSARGEGERTEACRGHEALEQLEPRSGRRGGRGPGRRVAGGGVALRGPLGGAWPPLWVTETAGAVWGKDAALVKFKVPAGRGGQWLHWDPDTGRCLDRRHACGSSQHRFPNCLPQ